MYNPRFANGRSRAFQVLASFDAGMDKRKSDRTISYLGTDVVVEVVRMDSTTDKWRAFDTCQRFSFT